MTQTEALSVEDTLKLALEALEESGITWKTSRAITAIKEALNRGAMDSSPNGEAQPEQEPVAWGFQNSAITGSNRWMMLREEIPANDQYGGALWTPLYTTPPQRKPLTDGQIDNATRKQVDALLDHIYEYGTAAEGIDIRVRAIARRAIEAASGIKG